MGLVHEKSIPKAQLVKHHCLKAGEFTAIISNQLKIYIRDEFGLTLGGMSPRFSGFCRAQVLPSSKSLNSSREKKISLKIF